MKESSDESPEVGGRHGTGSVKTSLSPFFYKMSVKFNIYGFIMSINFTGLVCIIN